MRLSVAALVAAVRFLPLYLPDLGESESGAIAWTGILLSGGALGQLLATPVWGVVAERTGPKAMVQRAVAAGAGVVALMALATQAWHLLVLRLVQGVASGVVPAMITLTTSLMPPARLGLGLGLLQTAQSTGTSLGPLLGGAASPWLGYRGAFLLIAYVLSWSLLPLQLEFLGNGAGATRIGAVLNADALGVAVGATLFGWSAGRLGTGRTVAPCILGAAIATGVQWRLADPAMFISVRLALGLFAGGALPGLRTVVSEVAGGHVAGPRSPRWHTPAPVPADVHHSLRHRRPVRSRPDAPRPGQMCRSTPRR